MTPFSKFRTIAGLALGVFLFPPLTSAQQGGQPGPTQGTPAPPGGAPGVGATPSPGGRTPLPGSTDRNQIPQLGERDRSPSLEMQRPIFLSGKVVLQDGTAPQEPVVIERVCNGVPRQEGYTDSKGRFSFQLGQNMGMMQDASISSASEPSFGGAGTPGMQ